MVLVSDVSYNETLQRRKLEAREDTQSSKY